MILADLFIRTGDLSAFRDAVRALEGSFPFDAAAMIDLGTAYFARYPETARERDMEAVLLGYGLVRVCLIERVVRGLTPEGREYFRNVFQDVSGVGRFSEPRGDVFRSEFLAVEAELSAVKATIDEIPKGSIKERFVGGISHLFNVLYVIRMNLKRRGIMPEA